MAKGDVLELDELWSFVGSQANARWVWIARCRQTRQIVAYVVGDRSAQSARVLHERIPPDYPVLGVEPAIPLVLVAARAIGVMRMTNPDEGDDKIIAVHVNNPEHSSYREVPDPPGHRRAALKRFFEDYKAPEKKEAVVDKFELVEKAYPIISCAVDLYQRWKDGEDVNPLIQQP